MNRPNLTKLPQRRQSLTDLKKYRQSKKNILFNTRILTQQQKQMPISSSKVLNQKLYQLYPDLKNKNQYGINQRLRQSTPSVPFINLSQASKFNKSLGSTFLIRKKTKQGQIQTQRQKPKSKTKILLSTINVKKYIPLF